MGASHATTQRLDAERIRAVRRPPNGGPHASRAAPAPAPATRPDPGARLRRLRDLAREGRLAAVAADAVGAERVELTGAAYDVAWPIVFSRLTRRFEQQRGHPACAAGVDHLADECLDRFHDDVEAVVQDLLAHARRPVHHLEGWIAGRLNAATVDWHRRLRGLRGALQRPRLPGWVADGLAHDPWLTALAVEILIWVGVSSTAGTEVWPLEAWAQQRGIRTGDWAHSEPSVVAHEVEVVLGVMRKRPDWYASYVERPLGAKHAPVAAAPVGDAPGGEVAPPLALGDPHGPVDAELLRLAAEAVRAIDSRVTHGEQAEAIVVEVLRATFGGPFTGTLDRAPHDLADPVGGLSGALADAETVDRIVTTVLTIIGDDRDQDGGRAGAGSQASP